MNDSSCSECDQRRTARLPRIPEVAAPLSTSARPNLPTGAKSCSVGDSGLLGLGLCLCCCSSSDQVILALILC